MNDDEKAMAQAAMSWYGWGSPVGIGIFITCLSFAGLAVAAAFWLLR